MRNFLETEFKLIIAEDQEKWGETGSNCSWVWERLQKDSFTFWSDENISKLIVVMVVKLNILKPLTWAL